MLLRGRLPVQKKSVQCNRNPSHVFKYYKFRSTSSALPEVLPIPLLSEKYEKGELTVSQTVEEVMNRMSNDKASWIFKIPQHHIKSKAENLDEKLRSNPNITKELPLFGIPFSVKDNIDLASFPTTAGCPDYSYVPWSNNPVVDKLEEAGAICVGKNNMDQFAAGLVGVRSPYGIPVNPFNPDFCPGGSSSGSGVVVSTGQVSFSLGTDTAGSGRIPACFTNTVGLKPSKGLLSTRGMVPACRSLDCMSIFALTCNDAWKVLQLGKGFDFEDEYSRQEPVIPPTRIGKNPSALTFAIPRPSDLKFYSEKEESSAIFNKALEILESLSLVPGKEEKNPIVPIDFTPFTSVAKILYDGPWTAERLSAIENFFFTNPDSIHPVTRGIIGKGKNFTAVQTFNSMRTLEKLKKEAYREIKEKGVDVLVVPTASITPTIEEIKQVPTGINTVMGYYTNFVNLLDLCAVALPVDFMKSLGMPTGITLIAPAFNDELLYSIASEFQRKRDIVLGTSKTLSYSSLPSQYNTSAPPLRKYVKKDTAGDNKWVEIAVVGAHLSGLALNHRLLNLGAQLVRKAKTSNNYELYDITKPNDKVSRPGLVRLPEGKTADKQIDVEVWKIPSQYVGEFLSANVSAPLAIGNIELDPSTSPVTSVLGYVCQDYATSNGKNITSFGGWRPYVESSSK